MKKSLLTVCIILLCIMFVPVSAHAGNAYFHSELVGEPETNIDDVVNSILTDETVDAWYSIVSTPKAENCYLDRSIRIYEYNVDTEFWKRVKTNDYQGIVSQLDTAYPNIYLPLLGTVNGEKRAIGHWQLRYDAIRGYQHSMSAYVIDDAFKNKEYSGMFELIADYIEKDEIAAEQVFLLCYPSSLTDMREKAAVIKAGDRTVILDIGNSLNLSDYSRQSPKAYSVKEYRSLRLEAEKTIYQTVSGWDQVQFGGIISAVPRNAGIIIAAVIACVLAAAIITAFVIRSKRRNKAK